MHKPIRWPDNFRIKKNGQKYLTSGNINIISSSIPSTTEVTLQDKNECSLNQIWKLSLKKKLSPKSVIKDDLASVKVNMSKPTVYVYNNIDLVEYDEVTFHTLKKKEVLTDGDQIIITIGKDKNMQYLIHDQDNIKFVLEPYRGEEYYLWTLEVLDEKQMGYVKGHNCGQIDNILTEKQKVTNQIESFAQVSEWKISLIWVIIFISLFILLKKH